MSAACNHHTVREAGAVLAGTGLELHPSHPLLNDRGKSAQVRCLAL